MMGQTLNPLPSTKRCYPCSEPANNIFVCPLVSQFLDFVRKQVNAIQQFSKLVNNLFTSTYKSGWRNYLNFFASLYKPRYQFQQPRLNFQTSFQNSSNYRPPQNQYSQQPLSNSNHPREKSFEERVLDFLKKS